MDLYAINAQLNQLRPNLRRTCRDDQIIGDVHSAILLRVWRGKPVGDVRRYARWLIRKRCKPKASSRRAAPFNLESFELPGDHLDEWADPRWPSILAVIGQLPPGHRRAIEARLTGSPPGSRSERKRHSMAVACLRACSLR